jgi:hydrogenase maturation protein HypF
VGAAPATPGQDAVADAAALIADGAILAIKGLGGYHLACLAGSEAAVSALRGRKHREDKPFALMVPGVESADALVELSAADRELLARSERPIVIARRRGGARVAPAVAPRSRDLGVMLPYTPLHHLLLADAGVPLVMTSANVSDEPIAYLDDEALQRLRGIADAFLVHDRPIHMRTDDSVVRSVGGSRRVLLRRSRGYVPGSLALPARAPVAALGCGAELKSTFCLAKGERAWVGHHIGDLKNWETLASFREGVAHFERLFAVSPRVVAHDLHPDYLSTRYALEREGVETVAVQHHHAHLAACLAEHGEDGPAVGAIFDGTGYGTDGTVWGGEILAGGLASFERSGMLMPVRLPGGDAAVREPWRMAASWLAHATGDELPAPPEQLAEAAGADWEAVCGLVASGAGSPLTTSVGRLFDSVAALCGLRASVNYEGQAAAELEGVADPTELGAYRIELEGGDGPTLLLDPRGAIRELTADVAGAVPIPIVAARFHNGLAQATAAACARECERSGIDLVVLSGGVFQNRLLLERTLADLAAAGVRTLVPERLPPNDGGIAYGQVVVAIARRRNDEPSP